VNFIKILHEVLTMTEQLPDNRFDVLARILWGGIAVIGLFGIAAVLHGIGAIRWW